MTATAWLWLAAVAWLLLNDGSSARVRRVVRAEPSGAERRTRGDDSTRDARGGGRSVLIAGVLGAAAILVLFPWPIAPAIAVFFVAGLLAVIPRLEPRAAREGSRRRARQLPLALDLLAACWSAGATSRRAAETVARGVVAPLNADLEEVATRLELGTTASDAWRFLLTIEDDGAARDAYRALVDASTSGIPPGEALRRAAQRSRESRRRAGEAAARTVAVKVAAPLGLCFLPAFVLLAIAPAVLGALLPAIS